LSWFWYFIHPTAKNIIQLKIIFRYKLEFEGIKNLSMVRQSTSDLVENQTRLFQTTMKTTISKSSISNISENQQKLRENFQLLRTQANKSSMKTTLLKQSIILESLLNQYTSETQNFICIINSAIIEKLIP